MVFSLILSCFIHAWIHDAIPYTAPRKLNNYIDTVYRHFIIGSITRTVPRKYILLYWCCTRMTYNNVCFIGRTSRLWNNFLSSTLFLALFASSLLVCISCQGQNNCTTFIRLLSCPPQLSQIISLNNCYKKVIKLSQIICLIFKFLQIFSQISQIINKNNTIFKAF